MVAATHHAHEHGGCTIWGDVFCFLWEQMAWSYRFLLCAVDGGRSVVCWVRDAELGVLQQRRRQRDKKRQSCAGRCGNNRALSTESPCVGDCHVCVWGGRATSISTSLKQETTQARAWTYGSLVRGDLVLEARLESVGVVTKVNVAGIRRGAVEPGFASKSSTKRHVSAVARASGIPRNDKRAVHWHVHAL